MNFKMNIVVCAMILTIAQCGYAVYNWKWVDGKPELIDRRGVAALLPGADKLPVEKPRLESRPAIAHYGDLTARLLGRRDVVDARDISFERSQPVKSPVYRKKESLPFCSSARPHCIIVNGMVCHRVDQMREETLRLDTSKKSQKPSH